jgi:asparagine synthase (glutamine-hydrolysing)
VTTAPTQYDERFRPRPLELAAGLMFGLDDGIDPLPERVAVGPVQALEASLRTALQHSPCIIAFSGGRDSSALLAMAVDVARREGLPLPVPVTMRFPHSPKAQESEWQDLVVRHLGLDDWVRITLGDELDYVGPWAQRVLLQHGVLWPANTHVDLLLLEQARGGCMIDGVDGDSVFAWTHRRLVMTLRGRRRPGRSALRDLHEVLRGPAWRRGQVLEHGLRLPWLTAYAQEELLELLVEEILSEPYTYPGRLAWYYGSRYLGALQWTTQLLARQTGTEVVRPFVDPVFLTAYGQSTGRFRFEGRTAAMRHLFGGLLPDAVLARETKATFPHYWGEGSAAVAASWEGEGVDPVYVDHDALRATWAADQIDHRSAPLVQAAWLARQSGR